MAMTFLDKEKEKTPFAATTAGLIVNTILGIPKATAQVGKTILRETARGIGSAALSASGAVQTIAKNKEMAKAGATREEIQKARVVAEPQSAENIKNLFGQELWRNTFGDEPLESIEARVVKAESSIKGSETARRFGLDKFATPLAFGGIMGLTALDLTPFGGLEKNAAKQILKETSVEGAFKLAKQLGADDEVAKVIAPIFASTKTEKEAVKSLEVYKSLRGTKSLAEGTAQKGGVIKKVEGERVNILDDVETFVHKDENGNWAVSEATTGRNLTGGGYENKNFAVKAARENLNAIDGDKLKRVISENQLPQATPKVTESPVQSSIQQAKASGQSFDEWVKGQGTPVFRGGQKFDPTKIGDEGVPFTVDNKVAEQFARTKNQFDVSPIGQILGKKPGQNIVESFYVSPNARIATRADIPDEVFNAYKQANPLTKPNIAEPIVNKWARDNGFDAIDFRTLGKTSAKEAEIKILNPDVLKTRSQLKAEWDGVTSSVAKTSSSALSQGEAKSIEIQAQQARSIAKGEEIPSGVSLPEIIAQTVTPVEKKVNIIDTYLRTPNRVMEKIGFGKEAKELRTAADNYWKELPQNIDKIAEWSKRVPQESNKRIFKWLDGQAIDLRPEEMKVAQEVKTWLQGWAERLKLQQDNRISNYITHIFDKSSQKEFDEELAKLIADKIPGSVYDPFTLKRLGARGYIEDTWKALDAYVKRGTRKVHFDPVLEKIQSKAGSALDVSNIEKSQWKYINNYISNINMRPTDLDESIDNVVKSTFGNKFGQRPVTRLTSVLRRMTYRGMLGLNPGSALRNLSQGINTYATLGEKYTTIGYANLLKRGAAKELEREGVLNAGFIQDKILSATGKAMEKMDKGLFFFFDKAEKINRGAAYFGAKSKALQSGKTEEQAIEYAKEIVRKTQFVFDTVDTPVGMGSDIVKTLAQFQTFTTKQIEFLTEMARDKNFVGLLRYGVAGLVFVSTIGKAFGMEPKEILPIYRLGTPPSLKFPVEVGKAILNSPNKYGQPRDLGQKMSDIGKATIGLIPAGTQIKKTVQGIGAVQEGESQTKSGAKQFEVGGTLPKNIQAILFGKYASPEAKQYFSPKKSKTKEMSF